MSELPRSVLAQIRPRADLHHWADANGRQVHAVDQIEEVLPHLGPEA